MLPLKEKYDDVDKIGIAVGYDFLLLSDTPPPPPPNNVLGHLGYFLLYLK